MIDLKMVDIKLFFEEEEEKKEERKNRRGRRIRKSYTDHFFCCSMNGR